MAVNQEPLNVVRGPISSVSDNIAIWDGVTGRKIKDTGLTTASIVTHPLALTTNFLVKATSATTIGNSLFQDNGVEAGLASAPVASTRFTILGVGTTSATFGLKVHNSTGTNNAFVIRNDGFSSFGSLPVTSTRLNIQSSGTTSATFALKLDNSTPAAIFYARSDRRASVGTSTLNNAIFTVDGNTQATDGILIQNIGNGIMLNLIGSSTIIEGIAVDTSAAVGVTAVDIIADISGYAFTMVGTGSLASSTSSDVCNISRSSVTLNGFDITGSVLRLEDNVTGITGDIFTCVKSAVNVFRIDFTGTAILKASDTTSASLRFGVGTAPTSPLEGDMWYDSTSKNFTYATSVNTVAFAENTIFIQATSVTVANTTTETTLISTTSASGTNTLAANFLTVNKTVRIRVNGTIANTGTPTIRLRVRYGGIAGTVILDTTALTMVTITGTGYFTGEVEFICRTTGASGTVFTQGEFGYNSTAILKNFLSTPNTATTTINTTTSNALVVSAQWGTASASNTMTITHLTIEVIK